MLYWNNNATTKVDSNVVSAMLHALQEDFSNPSATDTSAKLVRASMEQARATIAQSIGSPADCLVFTSGGTEGLTTLAHSIHRLHAPATTPTLAALASDHAAMLHCGVPLRRISVTSCGLVDMSSYHDTLQDPHVSLVSCSMVNSETGVIQPIAQLIQLAHQAGKFFLLDAVQAYGKIPLDLAQIGADYAVISAHKVHGPKGIGGLYIKPGAPFSPLLCGGGQEDNRRAGTQNTPGIMGMAAAAENIITHLEPRAQHLALCRDSLESRLISQTSGISIHSASAPRVPHTTSLHIDGCSAQSILLLAESQGLIASAGSACSAQDSTPSHVIRAMGFTDKHARSTLRISLAHTTTLADIELGTQILLHAIIKARSVQSPLTDGVIIYPT